MRLPARPSLGKPLEPLPSSIDSEHDLGSAFSTNVYVVEPEDIERIGNADADQGVTETPQETLNRELRSRVVQQVSAGVFEPPRLPDIAIEIMAAADDPDTSADALAKLIHRDQFLAVRVLRVANSAMYRPADRRIFSLAQAIARLGFRGARDVVVAAALSQAVYQGPRPRLLSSYWRASVGSAVGFQLVERVSGGNTDVAFLAGLLHNVGKPVLVWILDELIQHRYKGQVEFDHVAHELIHLLHARTGAIIVGTWDAPKDMVDLISHHHDRLPPTKQRKAVRKLRLANLLWELWDEDPSVAVLNPSLADHSAFARCGLEQDAARKILERYPERVAAMLAT